MASDQDRFDNFFNLIMFNPINYYPGSKPPAEQSPTRSFSMFKRIAAITFIFLCTALAWAILGATIFQRTYDSDSSSADRVVSTWGAPQNQLPPTATFDELVPRREVTTENGRQFEVITE